MTYSAGGVAEWGVGRYFTFFGSYAYYSYDFGQDVTLPSEVARAVGRHSVSGGVRVWLPFMTQRGSSGSR